MHAPDTKLTRKQESLLRDFLAAPERPSGTLAYPEFRGFLFAIATAPVLVQPSEWMQVVFDGKEAGYRDMKEAEVVLASIMTSYNATVKAARVKDQIPPKEVGIDLESKGVLRLWSRGFSTGFGYLGDDWDEALERFDESDQEHFEGAVMDLMIWQDPSVAQREYGLTDEQLAELIEASLEMLPDSLALVAEIGTEAYQEQLAKQHGSPAAPMPRTVGRNHPCPCGSGKKYKRCCLIN